MKPKQEPISIDEMKVLMINVVLVLFPKMMQLLLQSLIGPKGLLNKYNNRDLKVALNDTEKSIMEKLPKMTEFTIELCYKILRFEHLVPEPSSQWEILPDDNHQEITDDIKRIVFDTNDVFNKLGDDILDTSYETFKVKVEGIVARIDSYLGQESCIQCYEKVISLDTQLEICIEELKKLREIDVTGTTTPSLSDIEIQNGERFARIGWVIIDLFPKILRAVIQMKIAPDFLYTLCSVKTNWNSFTNEEQNKLNSLKSSKTYDLLDIPLAYRLLRQFSIIKEPTNKWGKPPSITDISTGDDVERIRYLRNNFAHRSNINVIQSEFDATFSTFKDICRRMDVYFNNDCASGHENDVSRKETTPMDNLLRQKYQRSLQELENIKSRFVEPPVTFYWGEAVELILKNLRQVYEDEIDKRKGVTDAKLRFQIVVQNIEDESAISRLIDEEFKDEINKGLTSIQLIQVSKGSIILHVDICQEAVCSEETFRLILVQFVNKVIQTGHLKLPTIGHVDVILVQEDEYTTMQLFMQESAPRLCFDFEIKRSDFETDTKLKATLGETVTTMLKHSNGTGHMSDVSATISTGSFGEISLAHPVFIKTETGEETPETGSDFKQNIHDSIALTPAIKKDPGRLIKSDLQTNVADETDSTSFHREKMETSDEEKYDEIFVDVNNLKCLLKIKGLPNDIYQSEPEERPPYVKDTELLYVEWTLACPSKWNASLISSNIQDNPNAFHDEFSIEFVYNESSRLIIHTTAQRCVFRSYSSLEVAVKNLLANILNVSTIKSTEPAELSASVLIMTKPEEESFQDKFNKEWKTDKSISGLKDNIVTCDHCSQSFSCRNCTSKINHIRRQDQALKMKDQTIQRLEKALTKREKEAIEEDESDYDSYYSTEKNNEEPRDYTENSTTTREIEMSEEPEQKKRKTATTSEIENLEENQTEEYDSDYYSYSPVEKNTIYEAIRMSAINPANTMQQSMGSQQGIMSTSIQSPQQGNQQSGSQQPMQAGIDPGNLPIIPNPPIQGQNKDRKIIWSGILEYKENIKSNGPTQPKMARKLQCQLSIGAADPEIITTNWPKELILQLVPQSWLSSPQLQQVFKSSRQVAFHFGNNNVDSLRNLHRKMGSGFDGCVHFPPGTQCDVRLLLLQFNNKRKAFLGLIPNDQKASIDGMRNVISKRKQARAQQQAGGSPQQFVQQPQGGLQMGQGMANSPQMQQPGPTNTMTSTGMVTQTSNMVPIGWERAATSATTGDATKDPASKITRTTKTKTVNKKLKKQEVHYEVRPDVPVIADIVPEPRADSPQPPSPVAGPLAPPTVKPSQRFR